MHHESGHSGFSAPTPQPDAAGRVPESPACWHRALRRLCLIAWLVLPLLPVAVQAQAPDKIAFDAALRTFETGLWDRAAKELDDFITNFPKSDLKAEVTQRRLYTQAELDLAGGAFQDAQRNFATYQTAYPTNNRAILAGVREAEAALKMNKPDIALVPLSKADLPFVKALAAGKPADVLFRGLLFRAEAQTMKQDAAAADATLVEAEKFATAPEEKWSRWQRLLEVRESVGKTNETLEAAVTFLALANADPALAARRPKTASEVGRLRLKFGQPKLAAEALTQNLAPGTPTDFLKEATLKLGDLDLAAGSLLTARQRLEAFIGAQPQDPEINSLHLRLGQAFFRQYLQSGTNAESATLLSFAGQSFQKALTNSPTKEIAGPLNLGRGWCLWEEGLRLNNADRVREAETNFLSAAETLPHGVDQAVARFKLADCLAFRREWNSATTNYLSVARDYQDVAAARSLDEPALQQAVFTATEAGNLADGQMAVGALLELNPLAEPTARSALIVGQALSKRGRDEESTLLLGNFLQKFPNASLAAEIKLTLVATRLRAGDWPGAVTELDQWIATYTNHPSMPRAEIDRWFAGTQAGIVTNAIEQVQRLAARYPTNSSVLAAQLALAATYFSQRDFVHAEQTSLSIVTNSVWKGTPGWYRAKLQAAEAARHRQAWSNASTNIFELLNDNGLPDALLPSAFFELGELHLDRQLDPGAAPLTSFRSALEPFTKASGFTNSPIAPLALGKMADCHLQLATANTNSYDIAAELYGRVAEWPGLAVGVRSKATMGLGIVAEKQATLRSGPEAANLLRKALNHYLDVAHGKILRPGERADAYWVKEAGREAGRLLEQFGQWTEAAALYDQLSRELPTQKALWEGKAAESRRRAGTG